MGFWEYNFKYFIEQFYLIIKSFLVLLKIFFINLIDLLLFKLKIQYHKFSKNIILKIILSLFVILAAVVFTGIYSVIYLKEPHNRQLLSSVLNYVPEDITLIFDSQGNVISEIYDKYHIYVPFDKIPKDMINAIVAIEDKNFWQHKGYDIKGILRSIIIAIKNAKFTQGASTITQQVIKHFILSPERTIERKINEISLAISLEKLLSKQKIFEIYVNSMFLGNGAYGIGAASQKYFNKPLDKLELHEIALIAGLFQAPSKINPFANPSLALARQRQVLKAMYLEKFITKSQYISALRKPLVYSTHTNPHTQVAPYFADYVKEQAQNILSAPIADKGLRIYTTLDPNIQNIVLQASQQYFYQHINLVKHTISFNPQKHDPTTPLQDILELAIVVINPQTGEILGMQGGKDYSISQFNRVTQSRRSPGSLFKPIIYSLALERSKKWYDTILVSPISIDGYKPKDLHSNYLQQTTLLQAFYDSYNTAAIELGSELGLHSVIAHARKLGIKSEIKDEHASFLGSSALSMFEIASVYSVFANHGASVEPVAITKITDNKGRILWQLAPLASRTKTVMDPLIADLMHTGLAAVIKYGTARRVSYLSEHIAGKTGTSNFARDNWFCGYSTDTLALVWVGTDDNTELYGKAYGATLALPIWEYIMLNTSSFRPFKEFILSEDIASANIHPSYGYLLPGGVGGVTVHFKKDEYPTQTQSSFEKLQNSKSFRKIF